MESGERMALEVLSKLIDLAGKTGNDVIKATLTVGSKSINAYVQNKNNIVVGENDIKKLRNAGEPLQVTKIDNSNIDRLTKACKDFGVPISIVKDNDENFLFYKQSDSKLVQMVIERILSENLEKNQTSEIPNVSENMDMKKAVEVPKSIGAKEQLLLMQKENTVEIKPKDLSMVVYDKKEIVASKQDFSKLKNSKDSISIVKVDKEYANKLESIAKEIKVPIAITKNNDNHFMIVEEKNLNKLEMFVAKTLFNELGNENEKGVVGKKELEEKTSANKSEKGSNINPKNNIRNKVKEAEERLNTPSVEKDIELDIVKEVPITPTMER